MSTRPRRIPSYRLHKPSGQARVIIKGEHIYLGKYGTPKSWEKYHRIIARQLDGQRVSTPTRLRHDSHQPNLTIDQLMLTYWQFAQGYYVKNEQPTGETDNIRAALRPLRKLYGSTEAKQFGPDDLEIVRQSMIDADLSRKVINSRISRIKRMFRWASKKRFVPPETYHGLKAVEGLLLGRSNARETKTIKPAVETHVQAALPYVTPPVRAMIQVQELTGMRPQEIRNLRFCDLDTSGDIWVYKPYTHKTEHYGHVRRVAIGPKAKNILAPYLKSDNPERYVFSPREAVEAIRSERRRNRKTLRTPSERARRRKTNPKRQPGVQYTKSSYENAIGRACKKANVPHWTPNQLRHSCATRVRRKYGIEGAAAVLGNSLGMVAEVYAESNFQLAIDIMREIG